HVRAALGAELARDRAGKIAARKPLGCALARVEAGRRDEQEHLRRAAGDVLALPAMALPFHDGLALRHIPHLPAIASAFQLHGLLPSIGVGFAGPLLPGIRASSPRRRLMAAISRGVVSYRRAYPSTRHP